MKRLLGATILAMMAVLLLATAAMGQQAGPPTAEELNNPTCEEAFGPAVCNVPINPETGTACPPGTIPGGDLCQPDPNATSAEQQSGLQEFQDNLAAAQQQYSPDVSEQPAQPTTPQTPLICSADTIDQFPEGTVCVEGGGFNLPEEVTTATPAATTTALPATGGPSLVLIAGALLVGAGLVLRRR